MVMRLISRVALAVALAGGLVATPAVAQRGKKEEKAPAQKALKLSKPVQAIAAATQKLQQAGDNAGALAKLAEAADLPKQDDDAEVIAKLKLQSAVAMKDNAIIEESLVALTGLNILPPEDQLRYTGIIGSLAQQRGDFVKASLYYDKYVAMNPADAGMMVNAAEVYNKVGDRDKAVTMLTSAIAAQKAAGQPVEEAWFRRRVQIAVDSKNTAATMPALLDWVSAYPTPNNWRDAVLLTRDGFGKIDDQTLLDYGRFQSVTKSLAGERDYIEYADTALNRGFPGEAKAAIDSGIASKMLDPANALVKEMKASADSKVVADKAGLAAAEKEIKGNARIALATGDAYYGYGNFAKAVELYKQSMTGTNVDLSISNLRLGAALAMTGDKTAAVEAFKAVKGGAREALAQYWMAYLSA